jgi:SSS family transporter
MLIFYLCVYLAAIVAIGVWAFKNVKTEEDFWVAGRRLGLPVMTGTYLATFLSGSSVMTVMGLHYKFGYSVLWIYTGSVFTSIVLVALFAQKVRRFGKYTLADVIGERFGNTARGITALLIVAAMIFALGIQFIVIGLVFQTIFGLTLTVGIVVAALFTLVYTVAGGFLADAITDFVQGIVIIAGLAIATPFCIKAIGGIGSLHQQVAAIDPKMLTGFYWAGSTPLILFILTQHIAWGLGNVGQPHFLNRLYAAKNEKTAMMAVAIAGIIFVPFFISTNWVALAGRVLLPDIANPDRIYPILVTQMLPPIVAAMILAAIMGGVMSTADSILLTASTTICRDFYQVLINPNAKPPQLLKLTRITVLIVGIGGFIFAMWYPTFATIMNMYVFGAAAATFFCPLVAAFYWKRATTTGVIASLIVGAGTTILWISMKNPYVHSSIAGIGFSALVLIIVSHLTAPQSEEQATKLMKI